MAKDFGAFLVGIVYLAVLFVLVRPGSQGPSLVTNTGNALASLINAGTGGGGWAAK
jgi:hypothetical protein